MCLTDLEKELTAPQHLFPDDAQMRAHFVTVINSRTRGPAPMIGNLNEQASNHDASSDEIVESEDGNGKKVFTKPRHNSRAGNTEGVDSTPTAYTIYSRALLLRSLGAVLLS